MTKLALGLALAGMFVMGYFSGGSLKDRELRVQSRPKQARSEQQSFSSSSQTDLAYEAATGQVEASRLELAVPLVTTAAADTAQFSKLMLGCKDTERAWRGRVLSPVVTTWWESSDRAYSEAGAARAEKNFALALQQALVWRGKAQLDFGTEFLELVSTLRFIAPKPEDEGAQICWTVLTEYRKGNAERGEAGWGFLGNSGGCRSVDLDQRAEPVVTHLTYDKELLGPLVTAIVIPIDVLANRALKYLPTEGDGVWREAGFKFDPMSNEEFMRELALRSNANGRAPAAQEK